MNLSEWAGAQHIHPQTAYRWFREGKLPVPAQRVGGLIVVGDLTKCASAHVGKPAIYARVSSADQKSDLDRQVARVTAWATSNLDPRDDSSLRSRQAHGDGPSWKPFKYLGFLRSESVGVVGDLLEPAGR